MKESNAPVIGRTPFQKWLDKYQGILYLIPWIIGFVSPSVSRCTTASPI